MNVNGGQAVDTWQSQAAMPVTSSNALHSKAAPPPQPEPLRSWTQAAPPQQPEPLRPLTKEEKVEREHRQRQAALGQPSLREQMLQRKAQEQKQMQGMQEQVLQEQLMQEKMMTEQLMVRQQQMMMQRKMMMAERQMMIEQMAMEEQQMMEMAMGGPMMGGAMGGCGMGGLGMGCGGMDAMQNIAGMPHMGVMQGGQMPARINSGPIGSDVAAAIGNGDGMATGASEGSASSRSGSADSNSSRGSAAPPPPSAGDAPPLPPKAFETAPVPPREASSSKWDQTDVASRPEAAPEAKVLAASAAASFLKIAEKSISASAAAVKAKEEQPISMTSASRETPQPGSESREPRRVAIPSGAFSSDVLQKDPPARSEDTRARRGHSRSPRQHGRSQREDDSSRRNHRDSRHSRRRRSPSRSSPRTNPKRSARGWDTGLTASPAAGPAPRKGWDVVADESTPKAPVPIDPVALSHAMAARGASAPAMAQEAWSDVVMRALQREEEGVKSMRETGRIPRGPPDLPVGVEIIDVKYIPYLVGKGGKHLVELNTAAGVSIHFDNSTKAQGYCFAHIYGTEEACAKAKVIIADKIRVYRPIMGVYIPKEQRRNYVPPPAI